MLCDPCHAGKKVHAGMGFSLSERVRGRQGTWHAFVRPLARGTYLAELVAIHASGFDTFATQPIASLGVDAGLLGVYDAACPRIDLERGVETGIVHGLGAIASTGGDSIFPVLAGSMAGEIVKLRLVFDDPRPEVDHTMPPRATQRYGVSKTFAVGDTLEHPKFGVGTVLRAADGKIDVAFDEGVRTLIHDKKT